MKLSTARRLVCMSYFTQSTKMRDELATATRIVHSADTTRYLFPDGSVLESNKGNWKVVGMEKNLKLEAAMRRFGSGQKLPRPLWPMDGSINCDGPMASNLVGTDPSAVIVDECFCIEHGLHIEQLKKEREALQELCNEKDTLLDKLDRPIVVRFDWWAVALVGLVLVAHYVFKVL